MINKFKKIRNRDELIIEAPRLKKLFDDMANLVVLAHEYRMKHPGVDIPEFSVVDHGLCDQLRQELGRLYLMEGGREIIEKCQEEAQKKLANI